VYWQGIRIVSSCQDSRQFRLKQHHSREVLPADDEASGAIDAVESAGMTLVMDDVPEGLTEPSVEVTRSDFSDDESGDGATVAESTADRVVAGVGAWDWSGRSPSCRRTPW
jgi:hypothetical protein